MAKELRLPVVVWLIFTFACSPQTYPKNLLDELISAEGEGRISIGWVYQGHELNVIVLNKLKPEIRKYSIPTEEGQKIVGSREQPVQIGEGTDAMRSPDGKLMAYRTRENKFVLANASRKIERTLLDGKRVLTPLYWSPDSRYLMYVQKGATWDPAALRCGDDTFYLMIYRVSDGERGSIFQGCQGFPYTAFQWLRVPDNLTL